MEVAVGDDIDGGNYQFPNVPTGPQGVASLVAFSTRPSAEGEVTTPGSSTPPAPPTPDGRAAALRRWGPIPLAVGAVVLGVGVVLGVLTIGPNLGGAPDATSSRSPATAVPRETTDANPRGTGELTPTPAPTPTTRATSGTWTATGSMLTPRGEHTATRLTDGRVLVAGGYNDIGGAGTITLASAELYDPATGSWVATGSMTVPRRGHTATLLSDGKVLVVDSSGVTPSAELYDPRSGTWTATGDLVLAHEFHAAMLLADGTVLVAGGPPGSMVRSTPAEVYDPRSGSWTAIASLGVGRHALTLTLLLDGTVLASGGVRAQQDLVTERAAERYDPASRSWTYTGDMLERRAGHAATLLPDGSVLVTGGIVGVDDPTNSAAEVYDPDTNSWSAAGRLIEARRGHTATLLPGGTVLMIGSGSHRGELGSEELAPPEVYDPANRSSADTARMVDPREGFHTATLLLDGTVLVTGGLGSGCCFLALAELFHP